MRGIEAMAEADRKFDFEEREIVLRADFEELDSDDRLWTSLRFILNGPRPPREGEWVYLMDHEGRGCLGQVDSIRGWMARVKLDRDSWRGDQPIA